MVSDDSTEIIMKFKDSLQSIFGDGVASVIDTNNLLLFD